MIRPVPKPKRRKKAERKPGSTLPRPQKKLVAKKRLRPVNRRRRAEIKGLGARQARPLASKPLSRGKPIRKSNPERQAKRRALYAKKLAAYRRSETYKVVEARADGRCEHMVRGEFGHDGSGIWVDYGRCCGGGPTDRLTHHHKTYARFGGKELPEDIIALCDRHNAEAEAQHPTRRRGR